MGPERRDLRESNLFKTNSANPSAPLAAHTPSPAPARAMNKWARSCLCICERSDSHGRWLKALQGSSYSAVNGTRVCQPFTVLMVIRLWSWGKQPTPYHFLCHMPGGGNWIPGGGGTENAEAASLEGVIALLLWMCLVCALAFPIVPHLNISYIYMILRFLLYPLLLGRLDFWKGQHVLPASTRDSRGNISGTK